MNRQSVIRSAAATLFAVAAVSAIAAPAANAGHDTYRRVVLGDTPVAKAAAQPAQTRVVPGPYAAHLIYLGIDRDQAVARARSVGEQATLQAVAPAQQGLNAAQVYRRAVLGDVVASAAGPARAH